MILFFFIFDFKRIDVKLVYVNLVSQARRRFYWFQMSVFSKNVLNAFNFINWTSLMRIQYT